MMTADGLQSGLHDAAACILEVLQAPVLELEDVLAPRWHGMRHGRVAGSLIQPSSVEDLTGTTPLLHAAHSKVKPWPEEASDCRM